MPRCPSFAPATRAAVCLALVTLARVAGAQTALTPAAAPALAAGDSASVAAVERLLVASDAQRSYEQSLALSVAAQARNNPALAAQAGVLRAFMAKYVSYAAVRPDMIRVYRETFTAAEVEELTRFYASDLGKRLNAKLPLVMARSNELMSARVQAHLPELVEMLKVGQGRDTPEGAP